MSFGHNSAHNVQAYTSLTPWPPSHQLQILGVKTLIYMLVVLLCIAPSINNKYPLSEYIKQRRRSVFKKSPEENETTDFKVLLCTFTTWKKKAVPWEGVIFPSKVKAAPWNKRCTPIDSFQLPKGWSSLKEPLSRDLAASTTVGSPGDETSWGFGQLNTSQGPFSWTEGTCVTVQITPSGHGQYRARCGGHPSPGTLAISVCLRLLTPVLGYLPEPWKVGVLRD